MQLHTWTKTQRSDLWALWATVWAFLHATPRIDGNKALALSMADTIGVIVGFSSPFIGSLSDRLPERWASRFVSQRKNVTLSTSFMMAAAHTYFQGDVGCARSRKGRRRPFIFA
eukprot:SAG11_NODE_11282_length_771_cov_1.056548_2_plen_113_part_01